MLFVSPLFLFCFLPLFLAAYYLLPGSLRSKNHIALAGSVLFFAWGEPIFVVFLIVGTYVDYRLSLLVAPGSGSPEKHRRIILGAGILLDVAVLIGSKYLDFIAAELLAPLAALTGLQVRPPHLPLVLGISFITFHRISYLVDSYKGRAVPPRDFLDCALYIFLFPQLIAGPIIRYHDIAHQIEGRTHTPEIFLSGFMRFSLGLAKKAIIADPLGLLADRIFALSVGELPVAYAWGGVIAYTLQIYFDFSGYSDMALGLGRMMGFQFPENFNRPYISRSITEFWQRWHISLSNWMRLYLYIPLGGNRGSPARTYLNLWIVFLVSGAWHGASWNFIVWGGYYGLLLTLERLLGASAVGRLLGRVDVLRQGMTFLAVMVGWVFFRSPTVAHAVSLLATMAGFGATDLVHAKQPWGLLFSSRDLFTLALGLLLACVPLGRAGDKESSWLGSVLGNCRPASLSGSIAAGLASAALLLLSVAALLGSSYSPFLYFRF
jgi:alginate O-acetyltransferase complex protein AlgI